MNIENNNKDTPSSCNDIVSHDQIAFTVDRPVSQSGGETFPASVGSADLEFEEAVNTELSPVGASLTPARVQSPLSPTLSQSYTRQPVSPVGVTGLGKRIDIDSLNEIKRANDLASKKVEMTN